MQITQHPEAELLELRLTGRLDATWADHLSNTIEHAVRSGSHRIALNMAGVRYISSLGVGVLVRQLQLLQSVNGSLTITQPSTPCRTVLTLCGLADFFSMDGGRSSAAKLAAGARTLTRAGATYQVFPQQTQHPLSCTLVGRPQQLRSTGFTAADCPSSFWSRILKNCHEPVGTLIVSGLLLPTAGLFTKVALIPAPSTCLDDFLGSFPSVLRRGRIWSPSRLLNLPASKEDERIFPQ